MAYTIATLKDLRDQCLAFSDQLGDSGTQKTLLNNCLNQAHRARLIEHRWPFMLWDNVETITLTAGTRIYPLHSEFQRPLYFYNRASDIYLQEVPPRGLDQIAIYDSDNRAAEQFALWSRTKISQQPTSSSVITASSSSASDTATTVTIRGITATGTNTETLTTSGVTPVAGTTAFTKILAVTKVSTAFVGTLTLTSNSAAVTNLVLYAAEYGRSYQQLYLLQSPDAADVIEYRFFRLSTNLTNDYDIPDIPPPFTEIIVWDALLLMAGYIPDLSTKSISVWTDIRDRLFKGMMHTFLEGQSVASQPRFIRSYDDLDYGSDYPRIHTS